MDRQIGIIDLGSNSIRLVIFKIGPQGSYKLIDDISDSARLSENMIEGRFLNEVAIRRAIHTITLFKNLCLSYGMSPKDIIGVATAAVRKAENRDLFLAMIKSSTGLEFKLISGEEEALYVYNAVAHTVDIDSGVIVDIGGGSTEIIHYENNKVINYTSIPIGAVVASSEYLGKDEISSENLSLLNAKLEEYFDEVPWVQKLKALPLIGLGGTIRNMAKIHKNIFTYPLDIMHNYTVKTEDFCTIYNDLIKMNLKERSSVKGLTPKRADIITGGLSILNKIIEKTKPSNLVISGNGLREGVLFEHIFISPVARRFTDVLDFSINNCIDIYELKRDHAEHVCYLALSIFDQTAFIHKLDFEARKLLRTAALLHDIGITVNYYGHQLHAFYLLMNARINGLTHKETLMVAAIAASHGKNTFKKELLKEFTSFLSSQDLKTISKLSIFLKLAESLDRCETGIVKSVECMAFSGGIKLKTLSKFVPELEISQAMEFSDDFKKAFGKTLTIV